MCQLSPAAKRKTLQQQQQQQQQEEEESNASVLACSQAMPTLARQLAVHVQCAAAHIACQVHPVNIPLRSSMTTRTCNDDRNSL
jgi:hypothetical protein